MCDYVILSLIHARILSVLILCRPCVYIQSKPPWVHVCNGPVISRKQFHICSPLFLAFIVFLLYLLWWSLRLRKRGYDTDVPKWLNNPVSYFLHFEQLWISVLSIIYSKMKLLWWELRYALIHRCKDLQKCGYMQKYLKYFELYILIIILILMNAWERHNC